MARDRASIRIDMWADQDFRDLSGEAQRLYMQLMSHPTLSYAGVAEWRPGRLAAMSADLTADSIERAGSELEGQFFIVIDRETEEVLVRSFVKHDGLMKQPKLVVSMTTAFAAVASRIIREVIAFEVQKLRKRDPDMNAWGVKQVETVLKAKGTDVHTLNLDSTPLFTPDFTPELTHTFTPIVGQELAEPTTTATSTATSTDVDKRESTAKRGSRLSDDWQPSAESVVKVRTDAPHVDHRSEHIVFVDYWIAQPGQKGVKTDWDATWRNWMRRKESDLTSRNIRKPTRTEENLAVIAQYANQEYQQGEITA